MKIAQIAPIWLSIPPKKKSGGTEQIISSLTEGLVKKGHQVTLFATKNSTTKAQLVSFFSEGIAERNFPTNREFFLLPLIHMVKSLDLARGFDIVHCHFTTLADYILLALARGFKNCLFTSHAVFPNKEQNPQRWQALQAFKDLPFVSISHSQRTIKLNFKATVYNGIEVEKYRFNLDPDKKGKNGYLFWIGRLSPQKGLAEAIKVSNKLGTKLLFTKVIHATNEQEYFEKYIEPRLNKRVLPLPELNLDQKQQYFQNAKLFLFPVQWREPFGLLMIESMATGTPVVAFARGSIPEVIRDGETGLIVNPSDGEIRGNWTVKKTGLKGLCEAVERIYSMPREQYRQMRRACRQQVEKNFTVNRMVDEYEKVYKKVK